MKLSIRFYGISAPDPENRLKSGAKSCLSAIRINSAPNIFRSRSGEIKLRIR